MKRYTLIVLVAALHAALGCDSNRMSPNGTPALWLPPGADTDVGARCYASGFCDLPFTSSRLDPDQLSEELARRLRDTGWAQVRPADEGMPPAHLGWQPLFGGGLNLTLGDDAAIADSSRSWHGAWQDVAGNVVRYHLKTVKMQDGRQPIIGYATYTPRALH